MLNLRSRTFAQGKFCVVDADGEIIENDPLTKWVHNPNPQQDKYEFLYNHLLYKSLGNNYINVKSSSNPRNIDSVQALFNLNQDYMDFSNLERLNIPFIYAPSDLRRLNQVTVKYDFDSKSTKIPVANLVVYNDLPNSLKDTNILQGCSKVDALIPALSNIDEGQRSKNLNLHYGGTFAVSNEKTMQGNNTPIQPEEQRDIERNLRQKNTIATATSIKSFRIASDLDEMVFDEQFAGSMQKITQAYEMNRDVMNYYLQGSKFNDQENAVVSWIQNSIQYEGDVFAATLGKYFNYPDQGKFPKMSYDHLPVMQVVEDKRAEKMQTKAETLKILTEIGIELDDAMQLLGIEL